MGVGTEERGQGKEKENDKKHLLWIKGKKKGVV